MGSTSDGFRGLIHKPGVQCVPADSCTVEVVLLSVGKVTGGCTNVKSASRMCKSIVIFLAQEQFVNCLVKEESFLQVFPLFNPAVKVFFSTVSCPPPCPRSFTMGH